jgi:hypothetical protein
MLPEMPDFFLKFPAFLFSFNCIDYAVFKVFMATFKTFLNFNNQFNDLDDSWLHFSVFNFHWPFRVRRLFLVSTHSARITFPIFRVFVADFVCGMEMGTPITLFAIHLLSCMCSFAFCNFEI